MFEAQLLIAKSSAYEIYSPWFPRGGDNAIFTADVIELDGAAVTIYADTKSSQDDGAGTPVTSGTSIAANSVGRTSNEWDAAEFKDLVRYRFSISGDNPGNWILFRMLPPQWFDDVEA